MASYNDYINQRTQWTKGQMTSPWPGMISAEQMGQNPEHDAAMTAYRQEEADLNNRWQAQLSPEQRADVERVFAEKAAKTGRINKIGSTIAKGVIGAAAGGAALTGMGLLGGAAPAAAAAPTVGAETAALPLWDTGAGGLFGSQAALDSAAASAGWFPAPTMAGGVTQGGLMLGDLLPAGYQSVLPAKGLLDQIMDKAPELLKTGGGLMGGPGGGMGGNLGLGGGGAGRGLGYTPPQLRANVGFQAPRGLTNLANSMIGAMPQPKRWGLLGGY